MQFVNYIERTIVFNNETQEQLFMRIRNNLISRIFFSLMLIFDALTHGLRTPNEGINQRYLKNWAEVADKICFGRTKKFGSRGEFSAVQ